VCVCVCVCVCVHVMIDRCSSDESVDTDVEHVTSNVSPRRQRTRPPGGQSSRPSSRQGQKYTSTDTVVASPVVVGYRDNVLPNRKVSNT